MNIAVLRINFFSVILIAGMAALTAAPKAGWAANPIGPHPQNPHYLVYKGKPTVLITSGEHYGAVVNLDFDYVTYLNQLQSNGLNLTRTFSGDFRGKDASPTLSPQGKDHFISPWAWSQTSGGYDGTKFDLDTWNDAYFDRLKDFVEQAGNRGIVVELVLFCNQYTQDRWQKSPLHHHNNIQGIDFRLSAPPRYLTRDNATLNGRQRDLVEKITRELRNYDNVYFEVANEPWAHRLPGKDYVPWTNDMIEVIVATTPDHMIAANIGRDFDIKNLSSAVSLYNAHYDNDRRERMGASHCSTDTIGRTSLFR